MVLQIRTYARIPDSSPLRNIEDLGSAVHEVVVSSRINWAPKKVMQVRDVPHMAVKLHPAAKPAEFWVSDDRLHFSAETSSTGPGYHCFLMELLDELAEFHDLSWIWAHDSDVEDRSGYALHRSYELLQVEYSRYLRELALSLIESDTKRDKQFRLSLDEALDSAIQPHHYSDSFVFTPIGIMNRSLFEMIVADPESNALHAAKFYPWWDRDITGEVSFQTAKCILWSEFPWRAPLNAEELRWGQTAMALIDDAADYGFDSSPQELCFDEVKQIIDAGPRPRTPSKEGIGYKRHAMNLPAGHGWTIEVPGYFLGAFDQSEPLRHEYSFKDIYIKCGSYYVRRESLREFDEALSALEPNETTVKSADGRFGGAAELTLSKDENGSFWTLIGHFEADDCGLQLRVLAAERETCLKYFRSVRLNPNRQRLTAFED